MSHKPEKHQKPVRPRPIPNPWITLAHRILTMLIGLFALGQAYFSYRQSTQHTQWIQQQTQRLDHADGEISQIKAIIPDNIKSR